MTKFSVTAAALSAIAAISVATAAPAMAGEANRTTKSIEVFYGDLDLTQAAHENILQKRIKGAVKKVCGRVDSRDLKDMRDHGRCTHEARLSGKRAMVTMMANAKQANGAATRAIR